MSCKFLFAKEWIKKAGKEILITNALRALICSGVTNLMRTQT